MKHEIKQKLCHIFEINRGITNTNAPEGFEKKNYSLLYENCKHRIGN